MPSDGFEIIDTHVHAQPDLTDTDVTPDADWLAGVVSECRHPVRFLLSSSESSPLLLEVGNVAMMQALGRLVRAFPDHFIGALMVEPHDTEDACRAIKLGVREFGLRCVGEQCQYIHAYRTDGREMLPVVQKAVDFDLAVSFHVANEAQAEGVARLAEKFPRGRFLAAHYAGGRSWRRGLTTVKHHTNIWVEIQAPETERIQGTIDAVGTSRITIGTDFFLRARRDCRYRRGNTILDCLKELGLKDPDVERICSGNAKELLRIEE